MSRRKRLLYLVVCGPVVAYLVFVLVAFLGQREALYPVRWIAPGPEQAPEHRDTELWTMQREFGQIEAYWMPASGTEPRGLVVYLHGNGYTIDVIPPSLEAYRRLGYHVLIPEYRGYGRTAGSPTEEGLRDDVVAWIDRATTQPEVDAGRLVLHGYSLSSKMSKTVARVRTPRAMILESTFRSVPQLGWERGLPGFLARDVYDTQGWLRGWGGPVMLSHGRADRVVPFSHGVALSELRDGIEFEAHDGGHVPSRGQAYWSRTREFLGRVMSKK